MLPKRLRWPVVSDWELLVGGSGEARSTIGWQEPLRDRGVAVDVLSRGYGRQSMGWSVDPKGTAEHFGDEPLEIARAAGTLGS